MENKDLEVKDQIEGEIYTQSQEDTKKLFDSKKKAIIIASSATILSLIIAAVLIVVFVFNYTFPVYLITYRNINDLKVEYTLDSTYSYVENINYDDYLKGVEEKIIKDGTYISNLNDLNDDPKNNGEVLNTLFYNISQQDGGTIVFDESVVTTPLTLYDDLTIVIMHDVEVSLPTYDYVVANNISYEQTPALFYAYDVENIKITGPGTLNGNGVSYTNEAEVTTPLMPLDEFNLKDRVLEARKRIRKAKDILRPHVIYFNDCEDIEINNICIKEAATWTVKLENSKDIHIKDVVINNNIHVQNADGIDIVSSQNVNVDHCFIATADDGVCIKSNGEEDVKNIKVNRCSIMSLANCFKIGTETSKNITGISLTNCYFFIPQIVGGYAGIAIESADGANISDVYIDNISMKGISSPLLIWLGNRLDVKNGSIGKVGSIRDVSISNVTCEDVEMPSAVTGCVVNNKSYYVQDLRLANFDVKYRQTNEKLNVGPKDFENGMSGYPEITRVLHQYVISHENSIYYDLPVYGLFVRHAKSIKVINFKVQQRQGSTLAKDNITNENDRYDTEKVFIR